MLYLKRVKHIRDKVDNILVLALPLRKIRVRDLMNSVWRRPVIVHEDETLDEVVDKLAQCKYSRIAYVVDDKSRLRGVISLGMLMRVLYRRHRARALSAIATSNILKIYTSEKASEIASRTVYYAVPEESLDSVLHKMLVHDLKEIPVIDENKRVIGELWIIDLLKARMLSKKKHLRQLSKNL